MYDIMSLLEESLEINNLSLSLQILRIFLKFTQNEPKIQMKVIEHFQSILLFYMMSAETA